MASNTRQRQGEKTLPANTQTNPPLVSFQQQLQLRSTENILESGLSTLFVDSSEDDNDEDDTDNTNTDKDNKNTTRRTLHEELETCLVVLGRLSLGLRNHSHEMPPPPPPPPPPPQKRRLVRLQVTQSRYAFGSTGWDDTGHVVWGASFLLAEFLVQEFARVGLTHPPCHAIVELGCGSTALPSLALAAVAPWRIVATDANPTCLDRVQQLIQRNKQHLVDSEQVQVQLLDWERLEEQAPNEKHSFHLVLAADVIYGVHAVPDLMQAIDFLLSENGIVAISCRNGRRGVAEFRQGMVEQADFEPLECPLTFSSSQFSKEEIPACFSSHARDRWDGEYSIYLYQRRRRQRRG